MCTHAALVRNLEYYMDDLVDCFEDFVRKSLLVISVALGTIILMVMYVLKVVAERASGVRNVNQVEDVNQGQRRKSDTLVESTSTADSNRYKEPEPITNNFVVNDDTTSTASQLPFCRPSTEEMILREIGLSSCSKPCNTSIRDVMRNDSGSGVDLTKGLSCISKHHLSSPRPCLKYIGIRTSCCSMCCVDDDKR